MFGRVPRKSLYQHTSKDHASFPPSALLTSFSPVTQLGRMDGTVSLRVALHRRRYGAVYVRGRDFAAPWRGRRRRGVEESTGGGPKASNVSSAMEDRLPNPGGKSKSAAAKIDEKLLAGKQIGGRGFPRTKEGRAIRSYRPSRLTRPAPSES
ncbi:hypothetical protein FRC08_001353 [Ceratobasidium sp. 394]|nr:hypothetical protein FRC08_001353 [Ceratobasidium sp. 394]